MGQLRDDGKKIEPIQNKSKFDFSDTDTVPVDTELHPPQNSDESGDEVEMESDGLQYLQDTLPVDDAFPFGDAFETQKVDFGGETQVMDVYDETQTVNLGDTQVIDDCDAEALIESDNEGSDETVVLSNTQGLSDDDSVRNGGNRSVDLKNTQNTDLIKQRGGSKTQSCSSSKGHHSGSTIGGFTSIRAASIRAFGLAAHKMAIERVNHISGPIKCDKTLEPQHAEKDGMLSHIDSTKLGNEANQRNSPDDNDAQGKELGNVNMLKYGSSAARKLFMDDIISDIQQGDDSMENPDGTKGVPQFASQHGLVGLSYMSSQEPGDLSQANALDTVDRFLELNAVGGDQDAAFTKSAKGKSKPVSSAKGTQSLARKATVRSIDGERGIFGWDDDLEDEGGGAFFQKKKDLFFENGSQRQSSFTHSRKPSCLKSKSCLTTQLKRDKNEQAGSNRKLQDAILSDSRLLSKNHRTTIESSKLIKPSFKKNLLDELNGDMNTTEDRTVDAGSSKDLPDKSNVRFDTQMAADVMEALQFGVSVTDNRSSHFDEGTETVRKSSNRDEPEHLEQNFTKKRACLSNAKFVTRQSKQENGTGKSSGGLSLSSSKQSKKARKQLDAELSKRKPKSGKEVCKDLVANDGENLSTASKVVGQREEVGASVSSNLHDGTHVTASSGQKSLKTNPLQEELDNLAPISHRTRSSIKVSRSKGENDQNSSMVGSDVGKLGDTNLRQLGQSNTEFGGRCSDVTTVALDVPRGKRSRLKFSQEASTQYNKRSKRDSTSTSMDLIQRQKKQSYKCEGQRILEKMVDNGKSLDKDSSHIKDNAIKFRTSKYSGAKRDSDNMKSAGGKVNGSEEASPKDGLKPSASVNTTPVSCTTPLNAASPICMGDEYHKQSCRKNLLRSSLMKELNSVKTKVCSEFTSPMKDLRKRRDMTDVRANFSRHLDADIIKYQKKILAQLGASVASAMSDATHFVTDKFVRTRNMLEAIAFGKPVVTHLWLESCGQANCFIDERNYILRDARKEKEFGFSMPVSLVRACQHPLLEGQRVLITPNTKPGKEILASLVKAVHGLAVERLGRSVMKDERIPDDILVLSCEEDYEICVPFLEKGAAVYSSELLLNGIVTQRLEYERHRLFVDSVRRTRSTIWLKKNDNQYLPVSKCK